MPTNPTDGREVVRCWMFAYPGTSVVGVDDDERNAIENADGLSPLTPAVAVPVEAYKEVRDGLARLAKIFPDKPSTARELLQLLPEVPTDAK